MGIIRVHCQGGLVQLQAATQIELTQFVEEEAPLQILGVGVHVLSGGGDQRCFTGAGKLQFERVDNGARDLVLDRKHIGELAIVCLRPQMKAALHIDELRRSGIEQH